MAKVYRPSYKHQFVVGFCKDGSAECLFCKSFGSEVPDNVQVENKKRKISERNKFFTAPFHTANFVSHMKNKHPRKWEAFGNLGSNKEKDNFFIVEVKHTETVKNYYEADNVALEIFIEILIATLLLTDEADDDDDGGTSFKYRSLAMFRKQYDGEDTTVKYRIVISCVTQF